MALKDRNFLRALSALFILLAACGRKDATAPTVKQPGLSIVAGAEATDTIGAAPAQALIVEVRGTDGELAPRTVVRFEALPSADSTRRTEPTLGVCSLTIPTCSPFVRVAVDSTDGSGRAKMLIRFGYIAETTRLQIVVPEFGFSDTVSFNVKPGNAAQVLVEDLGVTIGSSRTARAAITDRRGNRRSEVPGFSLTAGPAATFSPSTGLITGLELGVATLTATLGSLSGTASVTVVPPGRLVVWAAAARQIHLVSLNGEFARVLSMGIHSDNGAFPRFSGSGEFVTFHRGGPDGGASNNIEVLDTAGATARQIPGSTLKNIIALRLLASGTLLAVAHAPSGPNTELSLWSVAEDNTAALITPLTDAITFYGGADISPDGTKVAYICNRPPSSLCVLDTNTAGISSVAADAASPRWSPTGDRIAFLDRRGAVAGIDGSLAVVRADGTGRQNFGSDLYSPGLAWSPDGVHLLARPSFPADGGGLRIVRISDARTLRLALTPTFPGFYQPDWR